MTAGKLQVGQHLGIMDIEEFIHCFQFHHDKSIDEKIQPIGIIDDEILVGYRTKFLLFKW